MLSPTIYGCSTTAKVLTRSLPRLSSSTLVGGPSIGGSGWSSVASRSQQDYASAVGGVRFRSNRSRRGLYDGKDIGTGNNVSFSMRATKRKFKPNVFKKRVYSETLDEMVRFHLTTSALKSIDKAGGLDNYLLTSKHVTSGEGLEVKNRILEKMKLNEELLAASAANSAELDNQESEKAVERP